MPGKKKGFYQQCTARTKNKSKDPNQSPYHLRRGIEAKLGKVPPSLEIWGEKYQSVFRKAINLLQAGKTKKDLSRLLQVEHNIQWAWIDSLLTDAQGTFEQLKASKDNQISDLKNDIASGKTKTEKLIYKLEDILDKPTLKNIKTVDKKLRGIRSKINKTKRNIEKLARLESEERLHVCFGSKKLFNAQYHLKENGYSSHEEWLEDWRKVRSGNFYSVGKGSAPGNNPVTKVYYLGEDTFVCKIQIPKFLQEEFGEWEEVYFTVTGQRKQDLIYSLTNNKPVTIQIFRREHKNDNWYIHLTTYVQEVPTFHTSKNGCIGVDINAPSLDILYVKPDGNPGKDSQGNIIKFSLLLKDTWTEGQRNARLRDIAAFVVKLAETLRCSIALEGLDFSAKKATMRNSGSKKYNRMLSGLAYDGIRKAILNRAEKFGVFVHFVNPCNSSVIGCLKYQQRYGLNSAYSAAMVIGRIALGLKERIPAFFRNLLDLPVDRVRASDGRWKKIGNLLRKNRISRHQQFALSTVEEVLLSSLKTKSKKPKKLKTIKL